MSPPAQSTVEEIYPLSPMQQGMLFHTLLAPDSGAYIVQISYEIHGPLNLESFERAWQDLLDRHSILRSAFVWQNLAQPLQVVGRQVHCRIDRRDWRSHSPQQQQELLTQLRSDQRVQGFALSKAPLMGVTVLQLKDDLHQLIWHYHHLLLDGWSMPILLQEFLALYQNQLLPPVQPYRNYIAWLQNQSSNSAQQFWQTYLAGFTTPTVILPHHQQSPLPPQYQETQLTIDPNLTHQIQQLAQVNRVTLSTVLQAAWGLLLGRYSDSQDVIFGSVSSGRPAALPEVDRMVGLFVNTLPIRLRWDDKTTLADYLQHCQQQQLEIRSYEHCSLVEIQAWSEISRSLSLFESIIIFENYPVLEDWTSAVDQEIQLKNLQVEEQTNYPLTLYAINNAELCLELKYDRDRFTAPQSERLLVQLKQTLQGMLQAKNLSEIDILTPDEKNKLTAWNQSDRSYDQVPVHHLFERQVEANPGAIALRIPSSQQELTYHQLNALSNRIAQTLSQRGCQPGDRIGICLPRTEYLIAAMLAVLKLGGIYVPLDPSYPQQRLLFMLEDAQVTQLLSDRAMDFDVPQLNLDSLLEGTEGVFKTLSDIDQTAYLIYTSGSTGQPKGVQISHRSLSNCLQSFQQDLAVVPEDVVLAMTTIGFDIAGLEIFLPLISGATIVLLENARNPEEVIEVIDRYRISLMQATPATWHLILSKGWRGCRGLRALCGGEAMDLTLAAALIPLTQSVWNVYGPTETTIWSAIYPLESMPPSNPAISIGKPVANTKFHILDRSGRSVPIGSVGELHIAGDGLMQGYWQRPELNGQKMKSHQGKPCYATGDRASYREDGNLNYLGRFDEQVKLRGYRIEPGEIRAAIMQHPRIDQAIVDLVGQGEQIQLAAYYTELAGVRPIERSDLLSFLAQSLPAYMMPHQLIRLDEIPMTPSGKLDGRSLPKFSPAPIVSPQTPVEQRIAAIWHTLLNLEAVGLDDNFFDLGGHSLLMVRMQSQIQEQFKTSVPLVELFRYPTVRTLAGYLDPEVKPVDDKETSSTAREVGKQRLSQRRQAVQRFDSMPQEKRP